MARRGANLHGRKLHGPKGCFATKGVDTGDLSSRDAKMESSYRDADIGPQDEILQKSGMIYRDSNSHDGSSDNKAFVRA